MSRRQTGSGGPAGLDAAHEIFCADSQTGLDLLALVERKQWPDDRMTLVLLSIDPSGGIVRTGRPRSPRVVRPGDDQGRRECGRGLSCAANALRPRPWGVERITRPISATSLNSRAAALAPAGERLRRLSQEHELTTSLDRLYSTFVHLHVNRLGGLYGPAEQRRAHELPLRARDSLAKVPLRF